jgi:hypothetical protein
MAAVKKIEVVGLPFSMVTVDSFTQDGVSDQKGFDSLVGVGGEGEKRRVESERRSAASSRDEVEVASIKVTAMPFSMVTVGSFKQKDIHGQKGFDRMLVTGDPMTNYARAYFEFCSEVSKAYLGTWMGLYSGFSLPSRSESGARRG